VLIAEAMLAAAVTSDCPAGTVSVGVDVSGRVGKLVGDGSVSTIAATACVIVPPSSNFVTGGCATNHLDQGSRLV